MNVIAWIFAAYLAWIALYYGGPTASIPIVAFVLWVVATRVADQEPEEPEFPREFPEEIE